MSLIKQYYFNKPYIDYFLNQLLSYEKITDEEINIINISRNKYNRYIILNGVIVATSIRQIYKSAIPCGFFFKLNVQTVRFCVFSIISMVFLYSHANNEYYLDNKYIIEKYFRIDEKRYYESILNREIIKLYNSEKQN